MSAIKPLAIAPLVLAVSACASYYKVTEPTSGKEFYTQKVSRKISGGAIEFKDAKSGAVTTLQNSQVLEIDKKTYDAGMTPTKAPTQ